ncbi:hypothetical protein [Microbacterium sp. P5_E9]
MSNTVEFSERPDAPRTHITLRLIAQDPSVTGDDRKILTASVKVPWSRMEDGPRGARFHVVDFDPTTGRYDKHPALTNEDAFAKAPDEVLLTDRSFHAQQVYGTAARTLATFESALGRRLSWSFGGHQLYLVPHAFPEANAYYSSDDHAVLFGYVPNGDEDEAPVYTCLSYDVIVHETTHAILDGLRRRFLEPGLPDQAAFHEGLADIVALLSVFSMQPVVEQALGPPTDGGRLAESQVEPAKLRDGVLTSVAEQVGSVLTQGRGPLRKSAMDPPPADWARLPEFAEPHRRGEVLVAIVLEVLVDIWSARLTALFSTSGTGAAVTVDRARAAEEGVKAATHLLTMLIRGLDYLPPVEFEFADLLDAALLADVEVVPDDDLGYRQLLVQRFAAAGITRPRDRVSDVLEAEVAPHYLGINQVSLRSNRDEVFRFLWQNALRLDVPTNYFTSIESVLPTQRIGVDGLIIAESVATYVQMIEMTAGEFVRISELPLPDGVKPTTLVQLFGGGTLVFDQFGRLKLHIYKRIDDWRRQRRRIEYLQASGQRDTSKRIGFADGSARGQAFAELHDTSLRSGESW